MEQDRASKPITASMLYNLVSCPHRLTMDLFGDPAERDEVNPFIQLLWEKGSLFEEKLITELRLPFKNHRPLAGDEKAAATRQAMADGVPLIYNGRIEADDLLGYPDLLRKVGFGYVPIDIKSGSGEEGGDDDEDGKPKKTYAAQLSLYVDILERLGLSGGRTAYVWDVHGIEVPYNLDETRTKTGTDTLWQEYESYLALAREVIAQTTNTLPACAAICKLCQWYSSCLSAVKKADDLSLIPELGRSARDVMVHEIPSVRALAECNPEIYHIGKKTKFHRVGQNTLLKFHRRARLLAGFDLGPYLKEPVTLPGHDLEIFFDIEVDTMRDLCYLHGFIERLNRDNKSERYVAFFMADNSKAAEEQSFNEAWQYISSKQPCAIYYYSKYERTIWRKLQTKYPHVCTSTDIENLFNPATTIDLYFDVVKKKTEWPTQDHSIKTLAKFLGFGWRDTHPSGAASVQWYDEWVKLADPAMKKRILDYNEDDCRATRWVLDGVRGLNISTNEEEGFIYSVV